MLAAIVGLSIAALLAIELGPVGFRERKHTISLAVTALLRRLSRADGLLLDCACGRGLQAASLATKPGVQPRAVRGYPHLAKENRFVLPALSAISRNWSCSA